MILLAMVFAVLGVALWIASAYTYRRAENFDLYADSVDVQYIGDAFCTSHLLWLSGGSCATVAAVCYGLSFVVG